MQGLENILSVKNLTVSFNNHVILDDLSFNIIRDTTVAIVGPNGSGKSVLFKALLGLTDFQGEITWQNDVNMGYVPQKMSVAKDLPLTVLEFLKLKEGNVSKIGEVLHKVGFKAKAKHIHHDIRVLKTKLGALSGGELQRILMAYALLKDPNVLLLDEPTAGVDIEGEETFYDLFKSLKADYDLTILFISHDKEIVTKYADEIIKLNHEH